jgi:hypothetical protein
MTVTPTRTNSAGDALLDATKAVNEGVSRIGMAFVEVPLVLAAETDREKIRGVANTFFEALTNLNVTVMKATLDTLGNFGRSLTGENKPAA